MLKGFRNIFNVKKILQHIFAKSEKKDFATHFAK